MNRLFLSCPPHTHPLPGRTEATESNTNTTPHLPPPLVLTTHIPSRQPHTTNDGKTASVQPALPEGPRVPVPPGQAERGTVQGHLLGVHVLPRPLPEQKETVPATCPNRVHRRRLGQCPGGLSELISSIAMDLNENAGVFGLDPLFQVYGRVHKPGPRRLIPFFLGCHQLLSLVLEPVAQAVEHNWFQSDFFMYNWI